MKLHKLDKYVYNLLTIVYNKMTETNTESFIHLRYALLRGKKSGIEQHIHKENLAHVGREEEEMAHVF